MEWTSKTLVLMIIGILIITVGSGDAHSGSGKSKSKLKKCPNNKNVNDTCITAKGENGLCMAIGKSSGSSKKCKSKGGKKKCHLKCVIGGVCKAPPPLQNGFYSVEGNTMFGATATATCATNYKLTGNSSIHCLFEGEWSKPAAFCKLIKCESQPPNVTGGQFTSVSNPAVVGTAAVLECDGGCSTRCNTDVVRTICQQDGKWSETDGKCASNKDCPDGWIYSGKFCFFIGNTRMPFMDAEDFCNNKSSHLATFKSLKDYSDGLEVVLKNGNLVYWVGYKDKNMDGEYTNINFKSGNTFIRWDYKNPNLKLKSSFCAAWSYTWGWTMHNYRCNFKLHPLCKIDICG